LIRLNGALMKKRLNETLVSIAVAEKKKEEDTNGQKFEEPKDS